MRRLVSVCVLLGAVAAQVILVASPASAYEVRVTITGAGQVTETTPANLLGSGCTTTANNPTGSVGKTCLAGTPSGDYGWNWDVDYVAAAKPGYRFVRWESDGTSREGVICDRSDPPGTTTTYTGPVCKFRTPYDLQVRAVFVDDTAPAMSSLSGPTQVLNRPAHFTFSAAADPTFRRFDCRLGGVHEWQTCSSGYTADPPTGTYTLQVRAVDWSGNLSPTSFWTWQVDKIAPETTLVSGPEGVVRSTSASFSFSANEPGAYACYLDMVMLPACSSPKLLTGLGQGTHHFSVAAQDVAGNRDMTPATRTWTVDTVAPNTTLTGGPAALTNQTTATFSIGSTEAGSTYACKLDGVTKPCEDTVSVAAGEHTFTATATDAAGNTDPTPASHTWTVDTAAPNTTLAGGPAALTNQTTASFTVGSTESGSTYACKLDGVSKPCGDVHTVTDGEHTFTATATDAAGNTDPSPASHTWTVDTAAPDTTITSAPDSPTGSGQATFGFTSESGATFTCTLDDAPVSCTGPYAVGEGEHTFTVAATDAAGNTDPSPATHSWTVVDATSPSTSLTAGPSGLVASTSATFEFTSSEPGSFTCALDGGEYSPCTSPRTYTGLTQGEHSFSVRATDAAGNTDPTPATWTWTVDTVAPDTTITSGPLPLTRNDTASFAFQAEAGATFSCTLDGNPTSCAGPYLVQDGEHNFAVAARDQAGNSDPTPATWTWTVDTTAPTVTSWKPRGTRVPRKANPTVVFSEAMIEKSVEAARRGKPLAFRLTLNRKQVAATVTYQRTRTGTFRAVLNPAKLLKPRARYRVVLTTRASDLAGNGLILRSWRFRTRG